MKYSVCTKLIGFEFFFNFCYDDSEQLQFFSDEVKVLYEVNKKGIYLILSLPIILSIILLHNFVKKKISAV